jgi:hypothetical protein
MTTIAMDRAPSARAYDINGWFEVADNPISREGIFPYSGAQVGHPDRGRIFQVYRPGEELSAPDALASFRLMPIIDDHTMLGEGHTPAEDVGVAGVIGENVKFDRGVMTANLKIFSKALAQKIKNGKTELSCGYRCVYDFTPGVWNGQPYDVVQRQIRANHLALVDEGRMGPEVSILDQMTFTVDAQETTPVDEEMKAALAAIVARLDKLESERNADDEDIEAKAEEVADEDDKEKAADEDIEAKAEEVADEDDKEKAAADEDGKTGMDAVMKAINKLSKRVDTLASRPAMDEKTVMEVTAKKAALVDRLKPHVGVFDHSAMTLDDVAKYGVKKLKITTPAGSEAIALDAYLQARPVAIVHTTAADSATKTGLGQSVAAYAAGPKK